MKFNVGFLVAFVLSLCAISKTSGQSCAEILNSARQSFGAGHFYSIPALLKPCLDGGFNRDQRIEAYWLLTRTYLFIDDPISAEESYLKLLKQDYEYNIDEENDPIEIVYLSKKFKTTPIFILYAKVGLNMSTVKVINNYGVDNTNFTAEKYKSSFGFQVGLGGEVNVSEHVSLGLEFDLHNNSYKYSNILFMSDQQTFRENQLGFGLPLFLKYRWTFEKIRPYVYGGFGFNWLVRARADVKLLDRLSSGSENIVEKPVTGPELNITRQRNNTSRFGHAGAGVNYRLGYNYIMLDFRYMIGFSNMVSEDRQYDNNSLLYKYGYVDDDKRLNNLAISVGFVKPLYKPRKIKKASHKNFLLRIFKNE